VASYCDTARQICEDQTKLCPESAAKMMKDPAGYLAYCEYVLTGAAQQTHSINAVQDPAQMLQDMLDCTKKTTTCVDFVGCASLLEVKHCGDEGCDPTSGSAPPTAGNDAADFPAGVYPVSGDDPACVTCALDKCKTESADCFVDSFATSACKLPGQNTPTECCTDYRECLHECEQNTLFGKDPNDSKTVAAYYSCVVSNCDGPLPAAKAKFDKYSTCMAANCAGCAKPGQGWGNNGAGGASNPPPKPSCTTHSTGLPFCDACLCGPAALATGLCGENADCGAAVDCVKACGGDFAKCAPACSAKIPSADGKGLFAQVVTAATSSCAASCSPTTSGTSGTSGAGGAPALVGCGLLLSGGKITPACQSCADDKNNCCDKELACGSSSDCVLLLSCGSDCRKNSPGDASCLKGCDKLYGAGGDLATAVLSCITTKCASSCGL
jgi:hypothetical protein